MRGWIKILSRTACCPALHGYRNLPSCCTCLQLKLHSLHATPFLWSFRGKSLGWLGHVFRMPNNRLPETLLFGDVKGLCPLGLGSMMLHYMIGQTVVLVAL